MKKRGLIYLLFFSVTTAFAQIKLIMIDEGKQDYGPCEPSVAINPRQPQQIVVGSVLNNVYLSDNAGESWEVNTMRSPYGVWGDPCLLADYDNHFYYFHLSSPGKGGRATESWLDRIVCQRFTADGNSWSEGASIGYQPNQDQDKEWAAVDPRNNHLYLSWTEFEKYGSTQPEDSSFILVAKSTDHGESWSQPVRINRQAGNCLDDDQTVEGAVPAVGADGQVYVVWAYDDSLYFDRSTDGGTTWLDKDIVVGHQPGGWSQAVDGLERCNGMPVMVCDLSDSPYRGTIYVNWTDQRNGSHDTDVWVSRSTDEGNTWSEPVRVNNDQAGHQQFLTWMAIDPTTGYLYVVFYDRRNTAGTDTDVFLAYSTDGGQHFANVKLTDRPFEINDAAVFFGDYNNIAAYDQRIYPVWTQQKGKKLSIWTALIHHSDLIQTTPENKTESQ